MHSRRREARLEKMLQDLELKLRAIEEDRLGENQFAAANRDKASANHPGRRGMVTTIDQKANVMMSDEESHRSTRGSSMPYHDTHNCPQWIEQATIDHEERARLGALLAQVEREGRQREESLLAAAKRERDAMQHEVTHACPHDLSSCPCTLILIVYH
jgi:hypothetical protein